MLWRFRTLCPVQHTESFFYGVASVSMPVERLLSQQRKQVRNPHSKGWQGGLMTFHISLCLSLFSTCLLSSGQLKLIPLGWYVVFFSSVFLIYKNSLFQETFWLMIDAKSWTPILNCNYQRSISKQQGLLITAAVGRFNSWALFVS